MALADLSFKLYTDAGLTTPAGLPYLLQLLHNSDLSDNPQDISNLWFGSTNAANQLQDAVSPGVDPIMLSVIDTLPIWIASTVYTLGTLRQPILSNGFRYRVTTAGTSAGTEPTWPTVGLGSTVTDGTVVWTLESAHHGASEITLALNAPDLATNTPGDPLNIGTTILGGVANAVQIFLRKVNAVTTVGSNTGYAEHGITISSVIETVI